MHLLWMNAMSHLQSLIRRNETTLIKTSCYYVIHVLVAAGVAYAVTGDLMAALTLSLLEPSVQAVAYFMHEKVWMLAPRMRHRALIKTGTYYVIHIFVASCVAYAVTGDLVAAFTLSLLEPTVQMVFFFVYEKLWEKKAQAKHKVHSILPLCVAAGPCQRAQTCSQHCTLRTL